MPVRKGAPALLSAGTLCAALLLTACASPAPPAPAPTSAPTSGDSRPAPGPPAAAANDLASAPAPAPRIPGVGPATQAHVPDDTTQAFVVTGAGADSNTATATLYRYDPARGWIETAGPWPARNALEGWTADHTAGDLRSPIGVFRLGDAGGRLPDPGARLPYDQDEQFDISGTGFMGEPLEGSFDHVIAIDYNRVSGRTPLDKERPLGDEKGGGVWIHVDHGGPTQACVALEREALRELLRALDPAAEPVVVMGPAAELAR
ncbi:L,D-transpeptidase family protein [Streptomyces sp. TLI_105]|uniref:L,D-transpeptidase family protein n=1 Tax=Streptomyces sp. TLI_105 TaxID=1881019 RepID=UPI0008963F67|nr:L,D-transpeptidase family protein [Streptomyces sp. TLI_105]SED99500.1 L,D-peptidoglycan transpeptidase YkuD, ErfK/YbiS/YcfS/YnhG family [Streptomyces sp. TLI_105]